MTSAELFTATGEALYGPLWRSELGRILGYDEKQVRRWASGEYPPPVGVWADLAAMVEDKRQILADLAKPISDAAKGRG